MPRDWARVVAGLLLLAVSVDTREAVEKAHDGKVARRDGALLGRDEAPPLDHRQDVGEGGGDVESRGHEVEEVRVVVHRDGLQLLEDLRAASLSRDDGMRHESTVRASWGNARAGEGVPGGVVV